MVTTLTKTKQGITIKTMKIEDMNSGWYLAKFERDASPEPFQFVKMDDRLVWSDYLTEKCIPATQFYAIICPIDMNLIMDLHSGMKVAITAVTVQMILSRQASYQEFSLVPQSDYEVLKKDLGR